MMHFAVVFWTLCCCWMLESRASGGDSHALIARSSSKDTTLEAVSIAPSEYFEGNDGPWSSFDVRVGSTEQDIRVLVSTASPETLIPLSDYGCSSAVLTPVPSDCAVSRGNLFNPNDSSTYDYIGLYGINTYSTNWQNGVGLEANLGYSQPVAFANDTLGIGLTGPKVDNQVVGGIETAKPFYMGIFGLNSQPVNFTGVGNNTSSSFISTLKDQSLIPSLSWSYTAGAKYRLKQVYGQLIFSGYDTSRFTENSVTFTMADDQTRDLVVVLQSISYSGSATSNLLTDPISIFIDSTDPNLWLPEDVCTAFEEAFGLTLDTTSGLYLVNDTHHTDLLNSDAQVTFRLSDVTSGGDAVRITLPYDAFDLQAEAPLVANTSYYFPLKKAANETQYTLGRTFLQEAYLTADYERGVFNVSACTWNEGAEANIVTIRSKEDDSSSSDPGSGSGGSGGSGSSGSSSKLGGGAIAGIVIGVVALLAIIGAAIWFFIRRRRRNQFVFTGEASYPEPSDSILHGPVHNSNPRAPESTIESESTPVTLGVGIAANGEKVPSAPPGARGLELDGDETHVRPTTELHGESLPPPPVVYHELPAGSDGERTDYDDTDDRVSAVGTTPSHDEREGVEQSPPTPERATTAYRTPSNDGREAEESSPQSPFVSTLGSNGWPGDGGDTHIVSPTTPSNRGSSARPF